ncbi:EthD domain-containing protein [Chloroflexota bacterium]
MVKTMLLLKRKPGLSREEFRRQFEEVHMPLAFKLVPTIRKFVQNYVITTNDILTGAAEPEFDCIMELWFDDMEAYQAMMDAEAGDAGQALKHSAQVCVDIDKIVEFFVEEVESEIA